MLDAAPHDVVLVDDTPAMVDGAGAAGWRPVLFESTEPAIAEVTYLLTS